MAVNLTPSRRRPAWSAALLTLLVCACLPRSAAADAPRRAERSGFPATVRVRTPAGVQSFLAHGLDQRRAAAQRVFGRCRTTGELLKDEAECHLTNRLLVSAGRLRPEVVLRVHRAGATLAPVADVPGHWVIEAETVGGALELAEHLASFLSEEDVAAAVMLEVEGLLQPRAPSDPGFPLQWHLLNGDDPGVDLNVEPVWDAGVTGQGVVIGIVDLGYRIFHPDLALNYFAMGSQTASPVAFQHGTRCAGVAAAVAFNGLGGVGVAYRARLSQQIYGTSSQTAAALAFRNDLNHVKSNSYGPADNGRIAYMSSAERSALLNAVASGRGGRGTLFTWAAGNGAALGDRMDYDPYASNRFVISVGALSDVGGLTTYSEPGAALVGVVPSSSGVRGIYTTDYSTAEGDGYTADFGLTSACAPQAAGLAALLLEANPGLGWRDVQHVLIRTARRCDPPHPAWRQNGAGRWVNERYGFGALDAAAAVTLASSWRNVGPALVTEVFQPVGAPIPDDDPLGLTRLLTLSDDIRVEAVELELNVQTGFAGDLEIRLTSPTGMESLLAESRNDPTDDYQNYIFTSRRHWDEASAGDWRVTIADRRAGETAVWGDVRLRVFGTHRPGDVNCDRRVDLVDIDAFVTALVSAAAYEALQPTCDYWLADLNDDGAVDFLDIDGFVAALLL